jgi:hypothetical protein
LYKRGLALAIVVEPNRQAEIFQPVPGEVEKYGTQIGL